MTYKQIEASREIRLWIGQVIVPAITGSIILMQIPGVRESVSNVKDRIKYKFRKNNI